MQMLRRFRSAGLAAALGLGLLVASCEHGAPQVSQDDPNIITLTTGNFREQVLQSAQPVLVDFWAEWCGPCKILAPTINELAAEYAGRVKVGKVDVDRHESLVEQYAVEGFPTVLIFKGGKEVDRLLGVAEKPVLQDKLNRLVSAPRSPGASARTPAGK